MFRKTIAMVAFSVAGCTEFGPEIDDANEIVENLMDAGFPRGEIEIRDDGAVFVGGDAEVSLQASREMVGADGFRQYRTNNLVDETVEVICVDGSALDGVLSAGLDNAIANYNALGLRLFLERTPKLLVECDAEIVAETIAGDGSMAGFPADGQPYPTISIGTLTAAYGIPVATHVIEHELGHCIGLRHTDYYDRSISCGGLPINEGESAGAVHVPGTPTTAVLNGSVMNACYNSGSTGAFTAGDLTALNELYLRPDARAWVHRSTGGDGFESQSSISTLPEFDEPQRWLVGDADGDGDDDLVRINATPDGRARARVFLATGTGFTATWDPQLFGDFWDSQRWLMGDVDGDGKDDLVLVYGNASGLARVWVSRSTGSGFEYQSSFTTLGGFWDSQRWMLGRVNDDNREDLVLVYGNSSGQARAWVSESTGSGFEYLSSLSTLAGFWDSQRWMLGDADDDELADLVLVYGNASGQARAMVFGGDGDGFAYSSVTSLAGYWDEQRWLLGDVDDDGNADLVNVYGNAAGQARAVVSRSTGTGFEVESSFTTFSGFWDTQEWRIGSVDLVDERADLVNVYGVGS